MEPEEVAVGVFRIINAQMADLIRKATIEQGHDPRECVLVAYGGAGPTHAVFYGHEIGSKAILVLADSTAFSAEGMLTCDVTHTAQASRQMKTPLSAEHRQHVGEQFAALEAEVLAQFAREGATPGEVELTRTISVRYRLQVHNLDVEVDAGAVDEAAVDRIVERFQRRYAEVYGQGALLEGGGLELEVHSVTGKRAIEPLAFRASEDAGPDASAAVKGQRTAWFEPEGFAATPVYDGHALRSGNVIAGPAIVERMGDSVVIPPTYSATVDEYLTLQLRPVAGSAADGGASAATLEGVR
jgi:N-methylhydantoinase A